MLFVSIITVLIFVIILIYIFNICKANVEVDNRNLKIINVSTTGDNFFLIQNLLHQFNDVFIINLANNLPKDKNNLEKHTRKSKRIMYGNYEKYVKELPHISDNNISGYEEEIFIYGYKSCISWHGDSVLINPNLRGVNDEKINWYYENTSFINDRIPDKTFFSETPITDKHNKSTSYSHIIITRYLYNSSPAIHINYIVRKAGMSEQGVKSFIGFLNYVKKFLDDNKIFYFSIAGNSNIRSAQWKKISYAIFHDSVYISPGIEKKFITDNDLKNCIRCSNFIIISKKMAPYGICFYVSKPKLEYISNKYILVAEIISKKNKNNYRPIYDNTEEIYENIEEEKNNNTGIVIDNLTENEVSLDQYDTELLNTYLPDTKKNYTYHISDILQEIINKIELK